MTADSKNLIKAIAYAFAFGFIGVGVWVLIGGFLKFISAWIAFAIAFGIKKGYEIADGPKKWKLPVIITIYLFQIFISVYLMYYFIVSKTFTIGFFNVSKILANPAYDMARDYVLIAVFSALGLVFLALNDKAIKEKLQVARAKQLAAKQKALSGNDENNE